MILILIYIYIILYIYIYYCITNIILVTITIDTIIRYTYVYIIYMLSCLWSSPKGRHLGIWPLQWMASTQPLWYLRHFHRPSWFPPGIPSAVRFEAYQLPNSKHLSAKIGFFGASRFHEYPLLSPEICGLRRGKRQLFLTGGEGQQELIIHGPVGGIYRDPMMGPLFPFHEMKPSMAQCPVLRLSRFYGTQGSFSQIRDQGHQFRRHRLCLQRTSGSGCVWKWWAVHPQWWPFNTGKWGYTMGFEGLP